MIRQQPACQCITDFTERFDMWKADQTLEGSKSTPAS